MITCRHGLTGYFWVFSAVFGLACLAAPGVAFADSYVSGEIIAILNPGYSIAEVNARWGTTTLDSLADGDLFLIYAEGVEELEDFADDMSEDPAVDLAEPNYHQDTPEGIREMVFVAVGGTWADYEDQALTERIGVDEAHLRSRGDGVLVGVLDSGLDPAHIAFDGRLSPDGFDFVDNDAEPWEEANGLDDDGDLMVDEGFGHGSMVAGIVALVAPDATILPVRVLDDDGRSDCWTIVKAIRYAVLHGADVLNMSFGTPQTISPIGHQIDFASANGVFVVSGAGNEDRELPPYYPANHSQAFMVTALDSLDVKADFADYHDHVVVSAPGTGVRSAYPGDDWGLGSGCSFATPFVTGELALILSLEPELDWEAIEERLQQAVDPIYDIPGNAPYADMLGSGRLYLPLALGEGTLNISSRVSGAIAGSIFPNPSAGAVSLRPPFDVRPGHSLTASIHDASGRLVRRLISSGLEQLRWDGRDEAGRALASGVYFAHLTDGTRKQTVTIQLIR